MLLIPALKVASPLIRLVILSVIGASAAVYLGVL